MSLATAVTEFDETVMAVALPSIDSAFHASLAALQWVVIADVLAFAALLIPAGRMADGVGARRVFRRRPAFAARLGGVRRRRGIGWLIGARVLQARAGEPTPASFAIAANAFAPGERGRALGMWGGGGRGGRGGGAAGRRR